jgi:Cu2+-exporting ATPase
VKEASVNYANQTALVDYDNSIAKVEDLQNAVRSIGYDLVIDTEDPESIQEKSTAKPLSSGSNKNYLVNCILSVPVMIIGMFFMHMPYGNYISMVLAAPVVFYFGRHFFVNAWKQALTRQSQYGHLGCLVDWHSLFL